MPDYVSEETVETVTGTVARAGGTRRHELRLPADAAADFPDGDVVRLVVDGSEYHAQLRHTDGGEPVIRGAYDSPTLARDPGSATNRLAAWLEDGPLDAGRSVHVDIVEPGFKYGVRAPGESATYAAPSPPDDSLSAIAESLDE